MLDRAYAAGREAGTASVDTEALKAEFAALAPRERARWLKELRRKFKVDRRGLADIKKRRQHLANIVSSHEEIGAFVKSGLKLQRAPVSVIHRLREELQQAVLFVGNGDSLDPNGYDELLESAHAFVVQHDWAAAFKNAEDYEGLAKFRLPFDVCAFEFRVSGRSVIVLATDADSLIYLQVVIETNGTWFSFERAVPFDEELSQEDGHSALLAFLRPQIKAVSIALEAEVAEIEVVRAPHKLNQSRMKKGRPPLVDYHVVSLASRQRAKSLAAPQQIGARKRLHFRRGHWRHFETFKTWIRWTLVGDPDLGFVDKEYRL